jgi:hypothetical protein
MLTHLRIENFALIDSLELDFSDNYTYSWRNAAQLRRIRCVRLLVLKSGAYLPDLSCEKQYT